MTKKEWRKLLRRYGGLPDEYHGTNPLRDRKLLLDTGAMKSLGHEPLSPATLWELMAGTGGLSRHARETGTRHLPPIDYRWGWDLGRKPCQLAAMYGLIVYGCSLLVAAPNCHPWGGALKGMARRTTRSGKTQ